MSTIRMFGYNITFTSKSYLVIFCGKSATAPALRFAAFICRTDEKKEDIFTIKMFPKLRTVDIRSVLQIVIIVVSKIVCIFNIIFHRLNHIYIHKPFLGIHKIYMTRTVILALKNYNQLSDPQTALLDEIQ